MTGGPADRRQRAHGSGERADRRTGDWPRALCRSAVGPFARQPRRSARCCPLARQPALLLFATAIPAPARAITANENHWMA